jgi:aminoglycoside phosphotransferase (APT) family kinase protein
MASRAPEARDGTAPGWVTAALGPELAGVSRLPWGFTNETWGATTAEGERYAVTRMASTAAASFVLRHGPAIAGRVGSVGLVMPVPIPARSHASEAVVVSSWLDGTPAMLQLGGSGGASAVGHALGDAWRRLREVDIDGLALDDTWARPAVLAGAARGWLASEAGRLGAQAASNADGHIETLASGGRAQRASFVHGDLVPANLLLRAEGSALLDLESARIGDPLFDAAWFRWIVGYHHPELVEQAWSAFVSAAAPPVDEPFDEALLDAYPVLRILEILAGPDLTVASRDRWIQQLECAVARRRSV